MIKRCVLAVVTAAFAASTLVLGGAAATAAAPQSHPYQAGHTWE